MDFAPLQFDRSIPLFPLPNCVLFPGVVQPLHIFEPRYREMLEETLEDQAAIAMALLRPGWEKSYYGRPPIHEVLCIGRIIAHERLEDGRYNLLLHGVARARVLREDRRGLYRVATLDMLCDKPTATTSSGSELLQRRVMRELFEKTALKDLTVASTLASLFEETHEALPLSRLVDAIAFSLIQEVVRKQELLEELNPLKRGEKLLQELVGLATQLQGRCHESISWPPVASAN